MISGRLNCLTGQSLRFRFSRRNHTFAGGAPHWEDSSDSQPSCTSWPPFGRDVELCLLALVSTVIHICPLQFRDVWEFTLEQHLTMIRISAFFEDNMPGSES